MKTKLSFESRLLIHRVLDPTTGCINWTGLKDRQGYGIITRKGTRTYIHKYIFGELPIGLAVLHRCNNPACSNINHLYAGTPKQNGMDKHKAGRCRESLINHSLSDEQLHILANTKYTQKQKHELTGLSNGAICRAMPYARLILKQKS